jgi:hypothetical protein
MSKSHVRLWNRMMIHNLKWCELQKLDSPSVMQRKRSILTIEKNRVLQLLLFQIGKIHGFNTMTSAFDSASAIRCANSMSFWSWSSSSKWLLACLQMMREKLCVRYWCVGYSTILRRGHILQKHREKNRPLPLQLSCKNLYIADGAGWDHLDRNAPILL